MKDFCLSLGICFTLFISVKRSFASEAGMPQLNSEFWASQIFWLILIFSGLFLVIWKIFLPKITYTIENRKSKIVNDLNEAQKLKENAEKKLKEYNEVISNSKKEAKKIFEEGNKKLDKDIENKKQKFNKEIEQELINVEKEIKNLKKSSVKNINEIAKEITAEVTKQITGSEVNKSSVSAIVEDVTKNKIEKYL